MMDNYVLGLARELVGRASTTMINSFFSFNRVEKEAEDCLNDMLEALLNYRFPKIKWEVNTKMLEGKTSYINDATISIDIIAIAKPELEPEHIDIKIEINNKGIQSTTINREKTT